MKPKPIPRKNTNLLLLLVLLFVTGMPAMTLGQNQSFSYTQYADNQAPLNPAYSVLDKAGSLNMLVRKQWVGINGAPTTFLMNGNLPIESMNAAAGLIVMNDSFAIEQQTEINAYFAKSVRLGAQDYLAVSLNAGIRNYVANYSQLDSTDPEFTNDVRGTRPNIGFGVMYYTDWYYVGVSVPELTITSLGTASIQNKNNFINHYYFTGAFIQAISDDIAIKPSLLFSYAKGVRLMTDFSGILYLKETIGLGLSYRLNQEAAGILTMNLDQFHLGYSYQFGTSSDNLGGFNMATHEITVGFRFGPNAGKRKLL